MVAQQSKLTTKTSHMLRTLLLDIFHTNKDYFKEISIKVTFCSLVSECMGALTQERVEGKIKGWGHGEAAKSPIRRKVAEFFNSHNWNTMCEKLSSKLGNAAESACNLLTTCYKNNIEKQYEKQLEQYKKASRKKC
jgi:hypothetical protein